MTDPQLQEFMAKAELEPSQVAEIQESGDKQITYQKIADAKKLVQAYEAMTAYKNYTVLHGVFIDDPILEKMMETVTKMRSAFVTRQMQLQGHSTTEMWLKALDGVEAVDKLVIEIRADVKARLWAIQLPPVEESKPAGAAD